MIILKIILGITYFLIIPELLGLLITKFKKEKNNVFLNLIVGYIIQFASFELIYVPMYFAKLTFQTVLYTWSIVILILTGISIIINQRDLKKMGKVIATTIKRAPKTLTIIFLLLLIVQVLMSSLYVQNIDLDDSFYVATMTTTIETNSLFQINAYDGDEYQKSMLRYSMAGLVIWFAGLSEILRIHPAILTHTIWPMIAIPLEFMIYGLIAKELFKKDKEKIAYFLIFLSIIYIFGYVSVYFNFSYFAYRSSQGKALIANLMIPMIWLCYFYCIQNNKWVDWLILFCTMIASCFATEMGVFLTPFILAILGLLDFTQNRKFSNLLKFGICCLPQLIIGTLYLVLI